MNKGLTLQEALQELKVTKKIAKKVLKEELNIVEADNLGETITELSLDNGEHVFINPCAFFAGMVTNSLEGSKVDVNELETLVNKYLAGEDADFRIVFMPAEEYED